MSPCTLSVTPHRNNEQVQYPAQSQLYLTRRSFSPDHNRNVSLMSYKTARPAKDPSSSGFLFQNKEAFQLNANRPLSDSPCFKVNKFEYAWEGNGALE